MAVLKDALYFPVTITNMKPLYRCYCKLVICISYTIWLSEVRSDEKNFPNLGTAYEMPVCGQIRLLIIDYFTYTTDNLSSWCF